MNLKNEILKIIIDLKPVDWLSFNQIYKPILGTESANLYCDIYYQKQVLNHLKIESYSFKNFLNDLKIDDEKFKILFKNIQNKNLGKLSLNVKSNAENEYIVQLFSPYGVIDALKNINIFDSLKKNISSDKLKEISLLIENTDLGYDLSIDNDVDQKNNIKSQFPQDTFVDFYGSVLNEIKKEFDVPEQVLDLIKLYYIDEKKISFKKIKEFAIASIKNENKKCFICENNFEFLINSELNGINISKNEDFESFWKNILWYSGEERMKKFEKLFSKLETINFYKKITSKQKAPAGLEKWVKDCTRNKGLPYEILNAMISYVKGLLKKIPINYLIKMSETLYESDIKDNESFISHALSLMEYEMKNKNRFNVSDSENWCDANEKNNFSIKLLN